MIGLDLTYQALATPQVTERISALGTPLAAIVTELMRFFRQYLQGDIRL